MNKLFENWRRHLQETSDDAFLDELEPLLNQWHKLQAGYGVEGENIPPENLPKYVQNAPQYYKQWTGHPSGRRAVYAQTPDEESIEKQLIKLFMNHSDQQYLSEGVTWIHDLNYRAHAQQAWSSAGLKYAKFSRTQWVKAQGQRQRDVLSVHGFDASIEAPRAGSFGFYVKPTRVLYASKGDLATQTLRTAHADVKSRFANKLPKRAGMDKLKATRTGKTMKMYSNWRQWTRKAFKELPPEMQSTELWGEITTAMKTRDSQSPEALAMSDKLTGMLKAAGVEGAPPPRTHSKKEMRALRDNTLLNQEDVMANNGKVEEALMANWEITGWYMLYSQMDLNMGNPPPNKNFWKTILPEIKVPVFAIDQFSDKVTELTIEDLEWLLK